MKKTSSDVFFQLYLPLASYIAAQFYLAYTKRYCTSYGDRRWEKGKDAYDRFIWYDVPDTGSGKRMFNYAADVFSNPGHYNVILYKGGQQCDYIVQQILAAGGIGYENKLFPNSSYEMYKQNKTYWMNETGISRGVEL